MMDTLQATGYVASLLIGVSLGLIGGGGSILTMPVMVYLFGISPVTATAYSLFVVGFTSLVGSVQQFRQGQVNVRMALLFAATSMVTVFATRRWLVPAIPERFGELRGIPITESFVTMLLFAVLMVVSSVFMVRKKSVPVHQAGNVDKLHFGKLLIYGTGIGLVTGLLGAGGGFLLIPALVLLLHLPMKEAIGTSLLVIALNSLIGFAGNGQLQGMDWPLLLVVTALAIVGILLGSYLNRQLPAANLKKGFGWFVLVMGVYVIAHELFDLLK